MKEKFKLTPLERNWVLYDVANSAFILLVTTLVPIYFKTLTAGVLDEATYLSYWSYAASIATLCVAFIGPICGTMADQKDFKKPIFVICLSVGALGCALFGVMPTWLSFLVLFVIAKVGYTSANVFYDAMLPEITTDERMDRVSTQGYAFGYIGSVIPFVICLALVLLSGDSGPLPLSVNTAFILSFLITAVWWVALTVPLLKSYQQTAYVERTSHPVRDTFAQLGKTLRNVSGEKHVFLYLLAFFFFIDGVYTIIDLATAYGESLGLDSTALLLALLLTQVVAFPCSILFGRLSGKFDTGLLIKVCIAAYCGITIFAVFLTVEWQFWTLAVLVGMFQGGIQALSRSYLGKIIDPEHSGEYYGLMDICGKGASFTGTMLVGVVTQLTGHQNIGIGAIAVMFIIGFLVFCKADALNKGRIKA